MPQSGEAKARDRGPLIDWPGSVPFLHFRSTPGGLSAGHHRDHRGMEACRIPWRDRDRRVLPRADPASASHPAVLQRLSKRFTAPSTTAFVKVLTRLDPDVLDCAARTWAAQQASRTDPVAIDGKYIRGAARYNPGAKHLLVAAAEHRSGIVLGQEAVQNKSNEIPAVRTLLTGHRRARRDPRCRPPHRPVRGRAVRRAT